jgi:phosphoglycerate dehydrogenase-like enzyme
MKFKKIVLYDLKSGPLEKKFVEKLRKFSNKVEIVFSNKEYSNGLKLKYIKGADALITRLFDNYGEELFLKSDLKYIGAMHTDISHFNLNILKKKGIVLTNVPDYATEAVAELTISALLNISRQTYEAMSFVKSGKWGFENFLGWELKGKTLGIIGMGKIGKRVAEIAKEFGMEILYFSRYDEKLNGYKKTNLENLLKQSDVVSLHCDLNNETKNLIDKNRLDLMKKGSVLLNSARSELVDLKALHNLCKSEKIFIWFEAVEDEATRNKFLKLKNVYLTPHYGWMTKEAQQKIREISLKNMDSYLKGKLLNRIV